MWVIVSGEGTLKLNDNLRNVKANDVVCVAKEEKHQITNDGTEDLVFIEVQLGDYFGEDDVVRLDDRYGRI